MKRLLFVAALVAVTLTAYASVHQVPLGQICSADGGSASSITATFWDGGAMSRLASGIDLAVTPDAPGACVASCSGLPDAGCSASCAKGKKDTGVPLPAGVLFDVGLPGDAIGIAQQPLGANPDGGLNVCIQVFQVVGE